MYIGCPDFRGKAMYIGCPDFRVSTLRGPTVFEIAISPAQLWVPAGGQ